MEKPQLEEQLRIVHKNHALDAVFAPCPPLMTFRLPPFFPPLPTHAPSGYLFCFLACYVFCFLACYLFCFLACYLFCFLACYLFCFLACFLFCFLALLVLFSGVPLVLFSGVLVLFSGIQDPGAFLSARQ